MTAWLLSQVGTAKATNHWWRVALAVAAHESACGTSRLAMLHNNFFGIKAVGDQVRADHLGHRKFSDAEESWRAFCRLLARSSHYEKVRVAIEECREMRTPHELDEIIVRSMWPTYCPDLEWTRCVLLWLERVWECTENMEVKSET